MNKVVLFLRERINNWKGKQQHKDGEGRVAARRRGKNNMSGANTEIKEKYHLESARTEERLKKDRHY